MTSIPVKNIIFLIICGLFGFLSTPTPDSITPIELIIAVLLVFFVSPINIINSIYFFLRQSREGNFFSIIVLVFFTNIIFIGFFNGIYVRENQFVDFIRDFIPILYLLIPFFLFSNIQKLSHVQRVGLINLISYGLLIISMGFIYQFISGDNFNINSIGVSLIIGDSLDNIMQDPSITFGLMYSFGIIYYFAARKKYFSSFLFFIPLALIITCLFASVLRAPIGLFFILVIFFLSKAMLLKKSYLIFAATLLLAPLIFFKNIDSIEPLFKLIIEKNMAVGLSGRDQEILTVIRSISTPNDLIFGFGLGAALPDVHSYGDVRYTHNFFIYVLMKFGLIGLISFCFIIYKSLNVFIMNIIKSKDISMNFIVMIATVSPITISLLFEPMYKSLSFGLVILLITTIGVDNVKRLS